MNLAKHEAPKMNGVPALAPGYGRVDRIDGSISWQVDLGDGSAELVSRCNIVDELRSLVIDRRVVRGSAGRSNRSRAKGR